MATAALTAPAALAASPHYIKGPDVTVGTNSLTVSWKAAGLGNEDPTADFTLAGTVNVTSQCFTKSGNPVNGVPKRETVNVSKTETFAVRNGQVTGSITIEPLSTLTCTGKQEVRSTVNSYNLTLTGDSLDPVPIVFP
jgi:hypothetical protein